MPRDHTPMSESKHAVRHFLRAQRLEMTPEQRGTQSRELSRHALSIVHRGGIVAAYYPLPHEPGADYLLPVLRGHVTSLLLPISEPNGHLEWALDTGEDQLTTGRLGIKEPAGPRLPKEALARCDVMFVPALAVSRTGTRMGQGGGYYDRALAALSPAKKPTVATLVFEHELLDQLPTEAHDQPVDLIITSTGVQQVDAG